MKRTLAIFLVFALPAAAAVGGYFAAPALARTNRIVRLADRVALEEAGAAEGQTLESKAFRLIGPPLEELNRSAAAIEGDFRIGSAIFGAWCGLVVAFQFVWQARRVRRTEYEVDGAACVSCGRCYKYCPIERLAWKDAATGAAGATGATGAAGTTSAEGPGADKK